MLTCENCGKSFEEPANRTVEVTSLRVLCPPCTAARQAAKARKANAANASPAGEARQAPSSDVGKVDVRRVKEAPAAAVPATTIPAKKVQPRPESAPAHTDGAPPRPKAAAAAASAAAPSNQRPAKPAPQAKKPKIDVDTLASKNLQNRGSREIWLAFGAAFLVFGVAGFVLWKVLGQKAAEKAEVDRIQAEMVAFRDKFRAIDITTEEGAKSLIAVGEENRPIWQELDDLGSEVIGRTAKAKEYLERLESQKELTARLEAIEQVMARAAELPPSELADQLRRMDDLKPKASIVGAEFEARLDKDRAEGERVHMERLIATAEAAAATEPLDRAALTTLAIVEDDVHRIFEGVYRLWDKNRQDQPLADKKADYEQKYKHTLELSDTAVERFFTPDVVEALPWRDLLADASAWKTSELKGYEHNIDNGTLHLVGPDPSEGGQGVMSIGDKEVWRDFIVEMEITILKGNCELFFRLSPVWQKNVESLPLDTDEGHLEAGRQYTYVYSVIASTLIEREVGEDAAEPLEHTVSWTQIRRGSFGISVPKDTEIKFTKLRAKVLR